MLSAAKHLKATDAGCSTEILRCAQNDRRVMGERVESSRAKPREKLIEEKALEVKNLDI